MVYRTLSPRELSLTSNPDSRVVGSRDVADNSVFYTNQLSAVGDSDLRELIKSVLRARMSNVKMFHDLNSPRQLRSAYRRIANFLVNDTFSDGQTLTYTCTHIYTEFYRTHMPVWAIIVEETLPHPTLTYEGLASCKEVKVYQFDFSSQPNPET